MCADSVLPAAAEDIQRRKKLWEIDARMHCSIVGTCLTMGDLRRIESRLKIESLKGSTDFEIHSNFCIWAGKPGPVAKRMQKMLDRRYAVAVRRFAAATEARAIASLWDASLEEGNIPGPYWALMTHPAADRATMMRAFAQVHMLSHLVGAANRADIRRLVALERERDELAEDLADVRRRLSENERDARRMLEQHAAEVREMSSRLSVAASFANRLALAKEQIERFEQGSAFQALREELDSKREALAQAETDAEEKRSLVASLVKESYQLRQELIDSQNSLKALAFECESMEAELRDHLCVSDAGHEESSGHAFGIHELCGRRVVYVGGRNSVIPHLRSLVKRYGGIFLHHDGGLEEQTARLDGILGQCDAVFCPVDCVSHDACLRAKRACRQRATPFVPLRTCSLSSFVTGLRMLAQGEFNPAETS